MTQRPFNTAAVDPIRNEFQINESRLRKYAAGHRLPVITFKDRSTVVRVELFEHFIMGDNVDEQVEMVIDGVRSFGGFVDFDLDNIKLVGLKDRDNAGLFTAIMRHMLAALQDELCACGGLIECTCEKN